jgi:glycosyltransferase involved in cell wall biosynthesis
MSNRIIILSESASFPWGMAAANRVRNIASGLLQEGWHVKYVALRGADIKKQKGKNYPIRGQANQIPFCYPGMFSVRSSNWWLRRFDDTSGFFLTGVFLLLKKITGKIDTVIIYSRNQNVARFWISFLHFLKIPVVLEVCEWPLAVAEIQGYGQNNAELFCRELVPTVDGVLPISTYIDQAITNMAKAKGRVLPSFKLPILIDVRDKSIENMNPTKEEYMLYCGAISYMDIARLVVDIVHALKSHNINLSVKFTGNEDNVQFAELKSYAEQQGVLNNFEFTGFIDEEKLHKLMQEATCLLAPLPENVQSKSRFSTKIGYYLASGAPVVTNNVGDVALYLDDGKNAFFCTKCDPEQFSLKIMQILSDPVLAGSVGDAGRKLALEKFHYSRACKGLGDFLTDIVEKYKAK